MQSSNPTSLHSIIYTIGGGQTCDQVLTLAQFVAFCAEYEGEFEVVDVPFWQYSEGFAAFADARVCRVASPSAEPRQHFMLRGLELLTRFANHGQTIPRPFVRRLRTKLMRRYTAFMHNTGRAPVWIGDTRPEAYQYLPPNVRRRDLLNLQDPEVLADFRSRRVSVICGAKIRCWPLVEKHQETVRRTLALRAEHLAPAERLVADLRCRFDYLVAVHLRQGDYRRYKNGRFYFSTAQYVEWMHQVQALYAHFGRVGFVVVSNEQQDPADFASLPHVFGPATQPNCGNYLEDLAVFGMCDLVLATASSFAFWGAFQGKCPVIPLTQSGQQVRIEDAVHNLWDCPKHPDLRIPMC